MPEPDALEPALADALADHERTPPPRGATMPLAVTEAPAGTGVWVGKRRIASAPAWVLVEPHAAVRLSAAAATNCGAAGNPLPAAGDGAGDGAIDELSRPLSQPPARPTKLASPRSLITPPGAQPTEPPPLERASAPPEELTAQTLFREADAARAAGDTALALRTLRALVERFPRESATAAARYELALMEETAGSGDAALRDLAAVDTPALEEPKEYLRCRVLAGRRPCEPRKPSVPGRFPAPVPASAHDADALATETALALARGGCATAQALISELERHHPEHGSAARLLPPATVGRDARASDRRCAAARPVPARAPARIRRRRPSRGLQLQARRRLRVDLAPTVNPDRPGRPTQNCVMNLHPREHSSSLFDPDRGAPTVRAVEDAVFGGVASRAALVVRARVLLAAARERRRRRLRHATVDLGELGLLPFTGDRQSRRQSGAVLAGLRRVVGQRGGGEDGEGGGEGGRGGGGGGGGGGQLASVFSFGLMPRPGASASGSR